MPKYINIHTGEVVEAFSNVWVVFRGGEKANIHEVVMGDKDFQSNYKPLEEGGDDE